MKKSLLLFTFIFIINFSFSQDPGACFPPIDIELYSQAEVDSFPINYPNLTCIIQVNIVGQDITNLDSLISLTTVQGSVFIGPESASFPMPILGNSMLSDLSGLSNLTLVYGTLFLRENFDLSDLSGLENIDYDSLGGLVIVDNPELSFCSIESICGYINLDSANVVVDNNIEGCNSESEIEEGCNVLSINENENPIVSIYPNPATERLFIDSDNEITSIYIYNYLGQNMLNTTNNVLDVSNLKSGVYIVLVNLKEYQFRRQLVIE